MAFTVAAACLATLDDLAIVRYLRANVAALTRATTSTTPQGSRSLAWRARQPRKKSWSVGSVWSTSVW